MATVKVFIIYFCVIVAFLLEVDGKRGGGGSKSSRGGRSRSSFGGSSRGSRSYNSVPLSGRIVTGSSMYSSSTWRTAAAVGLIYGGMRYTSRYPHRHEMPPICTNNYEKSPEGRVYGYFICPRENETESYIYCCGPEKREYCCDMGMAQEYISRHKKSGGISIGAIIGIVFCLAAVVILVIYCCKKRKQAGMIIRRFSKKDGSKNAENEGGTQNVPLNDPTRSYDGFSPSAPPPSYDAITTPKPGYNGAYGLPYGAPQPPPNFDDNKSGLPPPDIDGPPQPYWTPYPPADGSLPYPLSTETPYPPSFDTPYLPPDSAPYTPMNGAPYQPSSGEPYPPTGGTPYPPPRGPPYPPQETAPYPTSSSIATAPPSSEDSYPPNTATDKRQI